MPLKCKWATRWIQERIQNKLFNILNYFVLKSYLVQDGWTIVKPLYIQKVWNVRNLEWKYEYIIDDNMKVCWALLVLRGGIKYLNYV
jgi:hypothetical protein